MVATVGVEVCEEVKMVEGDSESGGKMGGGRRGSWTWWWERS